jgi:ABC-2 type transport system ATP-binding protein
MFVRLGFAVAAYSNPDILIIDEALSVGDLAFQEKCLDKLRSFQQEGVTIILVTHGLSMVEEFCSRALMLDAGSLVADGDPASVLSQYEALANAHPGALVSR